MFKVSVDSGYRVVVIWHLKMFRVRKQVLNCRLLRICKWPIIPWGKEKNAVLSYNCSHKFCRSNFGRMLNFRRLFIKIHYAINKDNFCFTFSPVKRCRSYEVDAEVTFRSMVTVRIKENTNLTPQRGAMEDETGWLNKPLGSGSGASWGKSCCWWNGR